MPCGSYQSKAVLRFGVAEGEFEDAAERKQVWPSDRMILVDLANAERSSSTSGILRSNRIGDPSFTMGGGLMVKVALGWNVRAGGHFFI